MIICPNPDCGAQNVDGTQFCEVCGEELPQPAAVAVPAGNQVKCPECGELNPADNVACEACGADLHPGTVPNPIIPGAAPVAASAAAAVINAAVGIPNAGASTAAAPPPAPASPPAAIPTSAITSSPVPAAVPAAVAAASGPELKPGIVKLVVEQGQTVGAQFVLADTEILVGREDEEEDIYPDIDLSDQDAGYVHRRHATLRFENGALTVTHLGGSNRTRVNNKPIPDNVPQAIVPGDKIAFGKVVLRLLPA